MTLGSNTEAAWDRESDVVVVGAGAGALAAALRLGSEGLDVVVLEKTEYLGGTAAYAGGGLWFPDTEIQRRAGVEDSLEDARTYLREVIGEYEVDRREAYLSAAASVVEFLDANPNLNFQWLPFPDYFAVPGRREIGRTFYPVPKSAEEAGRFADLIRPEAGLDREGTADGSEPLEGGRALICGLLQAVEETGKVDYMLRTAARTLVVEDERVTGVEAQDAEGRTIRLKGRHAVLLAAGGMEAAEELRTRHHIPGSAAMTIGPRGMNTGDMILAAVEIGADTTLLEEAWWCTGTAQPGGRAGFMLGMRRGIIVDDDGRRFFNESLPYERGARALMDHGLEMAHLVFDSAEGGIFPASVIPEVSKEQNLAAGTWVTARTLAGLAEAIGVPADALEATVREFNGYAERGVDEAFHRGEDEFDLYFCHGDDANGEAVPPKNPVLRPLTEPPFFAATVVVSDLGTKGGLRADVDARVLRADDSVIEGLYATGNTTASFTAHAYPSPGMPIGAGIAFGYRAAERIAGEAR
jgi:3-oxosteroid 1-dehydrogenase